MFVGDTEFCDTSELRSIPVGPKVFLIGAMVRALCCKLPPSFVFYFGLVIPVFVTCVKAKQLNSIH